MTPTVLQPLNVQTITADRLLRKIDIALGITNYPVPGTSASATDSARREEHFRIARRVLNHLLGEDISFSTNDLATPDAEQDSKLARLYQSVEARRLYANAMGTSEAEVSPWMLHQFFARIAWLDESGVTTESARRQLENFLYESTPFWGVETVLGRGAYSELGELLTVVPEDLRQWMVQFKRGARLVPMGEWIALSSGRALYNGLAAQQNVLADEGKRTALSRLCDVLSGIVPTNEYRDNALLSSLDEQLKMPRVWTSLILNLEAMPRNDRPDANLRVDLSTHTSVATRVEYFRKIAVYVVNPDNERWLVPAIDKAKSASGMRALSLAIKLRFEHSGLAFESAMALAAVLLMPMSPSKSELGHSLLTSQALNVDIPRLDTWSTLRGADYLFQQLGIDLLCNGNGKERVLRFTPRDTWHALIQTAQFKTTFAPLLDRLGWYGGQAGERTSPRITQALAGRAIVDYFLGAAGTDSESLAKTLRRGWVCGYSHVQLCEKVRANILARQPQASASTRDMLFYLLLRETMPELLVRGVPDHLQYGRSLQSVALIHGVALVEARMPGLAQTVPYDELIKTSVAVARSTDASAQAMWAKTLVIPALRYATVHGAIRWSGDDDIQQATAVQISQAMTHLKAQQDAHADELNDLLSLKAPDRKHLAQQILRDAGVDRRLWDDAIKIHHWPILQEHGLTIAPTYSIDRLMAVGRPQATVVELVMMGEVYAAGKPTVPEAYASAFDLFRQSLVSAQTAVMKRLLEEARTDDQTSLLESTCEVSRVYFDKDEGIHGLFIRCQYGNHLEDFHGHSVSERFFELIPASGVVREVTQEFKYSVEGVEWTGIISISEALRKREAHQQRLAMASATPLLPMDSDAYLKGTVSRSTAALHQPRQGILIPSGRLVYLADASKQVRLETLAATAADHLLANFLEQTQIKHLHETKWEEIWAKERRYADMAARLIIPFYGCIKDLAAGDRSGGVIIGCVMDAAFALIPLGQFAGSTARIILRAGEMSVVSVARLTGAAVSRLASELAEQSTIFLVRDLGKLGLKLGRAVWTELLEELPSLKSVFSSPAMVNDAVLFDNGVYRIADSLEHPWLPTLEDLDKRGMVDSRSNVAVRNVGTAQTPDFRLLDPEADSAFGRTLTIISDKEPVELSVLSFLDSIGPDHYPMVLPVKAAEEDFVEIGIAQSCHLRAIQREEGVFDILVDNQIYHLDTTAPDTALRKLAVEKLSPRSSLLEGTENLCRVRRDLISVPCTSGVKLSTPTPEPLAPGSTSPKRTGKYPSHAMDAREFKLARLSVNADSTVSGIDVFVNEGKFCKWAERSKVKASTSAQGAAGKLVVPLSEKERALFSLPETPDYLSEFDGALASDGALGLPVNFPVEDAQWIYENAPVIELGSIAAQINDSRSLRGIRRDLDGEDWIFIEPDTGVVYKARTPATGTTGLKFSQASDANEINEFFRLSEEYRLVRERPEVLTDRENIARLLFDLMDESERVSWSVSWGNDLTTYDQYVQWCLANKQKNDLLRFATNILAGEAIQKKFVTLAKGSIPDFKKIAERSLPDQQHVVEVLNQLLPVQGSTATWETLGLQNIGTATATGNIMQQVKGANLSVVQVYTEEGERIVYYALSGGRKAKELKLQLDVAESTERVIDGVIYRDARARMVGRQPDLKFTSLPVVRDADHVVVRAFSRQLDSERLIATILKEDMKSTRLSHIKVFTVMDTCRSCGGVVLPRLKLDFPDAQFSVTYLKDYKTS